MKARPTIKGALAILFYAGGIALMWYCIHLSADSESLMGMLIGGLLVMLGQIINHYFPNRGDNTGSSSRDKSGDNSG